MSRGRTEREDDPRLLQKSEVADKQLGVRRPLSRSAVSRWRKSASSRPTCSRGVASGFSAFNRMAAIGLRSSWARPAASWPTAAKRSAALYRWRQAVDQDLFVQAVNPDLFVRETHPPERLIRGTWESVSELVDQGRVTACYRSLNAKQRRKNRPRRWIARLMNCAARLKRHIGLTNFQMSDRNATFR